MKTADWIQLAAVILSAGATVAAWLAAASARDSAKQTRIARLIEVHSGRLAALRELYRTIAKMGLGSRVEGLPGMVYAIGLPLPQCRRVAEGVHEGSPLKSLGGKGAAEAELREAILAENAAIDQLERELRGRKRLGSTGSAHLS